MKKETLIITSCLSLAFIVNVIFLCIFSTRVLRLETVKMSAALLVLLELSLITLSATTLHKYQLQSTSTAYFKSLYQGILLNTSTGIAIINDAKVLEFANHAYADMLGLGNMPLAGRSFWNALPPDLCQFISTYNILTQTTEPNQYCQTICYEDRCIHYNIFSVKDEHGDYKCIVTSDDHTDIVNTDQQLQDQLKEIQFHADSKEALFANVSHELKTPLNAIIGLNHILSGTELTAKQEELISKINVSSEFLLSLINDILIFSKIKNGSLALFPSQFMLADLLVDIRKIFYPLTQKQDIKFEEDYNFPPNLCLHLDRLRLEQVLVNLINNALKFTEIGYVKLSVVVTQELSESMTLKFSVEDTGIGIDYSDISSLFTEFKQLENHLTKLHQGTGLGLPICKNLVEKMGGSMWVESQNGMGSTFFFTITTPKSYKAIEATAQDAVAEGTLHGNGEKVLVVEDTLLNYEVVEDLLAQVNIFCDHAKNGLEAIKMYKQSGLSKYKAILMDIHMPEMNGYQTSENLRHMGVKLPIIALTASSMDSADQEKYKHLFDGFIFKPFKHTQLYAALFPYFNGSFQPSWVGAEPTLPISDKTFAISNLSGSTALYEKHLCKFQTNYADAGDRFNLLIQSGQLVEAERFIHSVKGLSAMLGLVALSDCANVLEKALIDGEKNLTTLSSNFCEKLAASMSVK
ncbi:MAG: ATP-binding protein [Anaerovoracaceae bacterium]